MMVKTLGLWWRFSLKPIHCWHRGWLRPAHDGRGETPGAVPTAPAAATGAKAAGRDGTEGGEGPLTKTIEAGWWFGTFSIYWECHDPNWRTPSFIRGVDIPLWRLGWWIYMICWGSFGILNMGCIIWNVKNPNYNPMFKMGSIIDPI